VKYPVYIFILIMLLLNNLYPQETKICLYKIDSGSDSAVFYSFSITPYKGDSVYNIEIFMIDASCGKAVSVSFAAISLEIRRIEKEVFYRDKFGNKLAAFKFEYIIAKNDEYSDCYLSVHEKKNSKTLDGKITVKPGKRFKFIFDNSHGLKKEFDLIE
jgi:hypothetical protein